VTATRIDPDADTPIPLVSVDGGVYGFGAILLQDQEINFDYGNEEFVLNTWDAELGGSGTVLWDEGHDQYWTLDKCSKFHSYAEDNGYTVRATTSLASDLSNADAAVITSPSDFTESELQELYDFVANGGALFLHDQSDYSNHDETVNLNDVAGYLGLAFRFNDDDINDDTNNVGGDSYDVLTNQFNASTFDVFADRSGIGLDAGVRYQATVDSVTDGDTVDVTFAAARQPKSGSSATTPRRRSRTASTRRFRSGRASKTSSISRIGAGRRRTTPNRSSAARPSNSNSTPPRTCGTPSAACWRTSTTTATATAVSIPCSTGK